MVNLTTSPDELLAIAELGNSAYSANDSLSEAPLTTGRFLVTFRDVIDPTKIDQILAELGFVANARDIQARESPYEGLEAASSLHLPAFGIAVVAPQDGDEGEKFRAWRKRFSDAIEAVEEETFVSALGFLDEPSAMSALAVGQPQWGIKATGVLNSNWSGQGIKVAVLDTGFGRNAQHPDFVGRIIRGGNFVNGQDVANDLDGHGTHCIGIACGPQSPKNVGRYGVAYEAEIWAGKVLSDTGKGAHANIVLGMHWAIDSGCHVISMSLGGEGSPNAAYEQAARRALDNKCLVIAAVGNDSNRPDKVMPAITPANCASVYRVGAVNEQIENAPFSNQNATVVAPGVGIFSSHSTEESGYASMSGTSMATPFVSGIAALIAQSNAEYRGSNLALRLNQAVRDLEESDTGFGIIQAPI